MEDAKIYALGDIAAAAQIKIQQDFNNIDPVIGIMRSLRASGFPADAMTIDCIPSKKRIILILHDSRPDEVDYQFSYIDQDPAERFETMAYKDVTEDQVYNWIKDYFGS